MTAEGSVSLVKQNFMCKLKRFEFVSHDYTAGKQFISYSEYFRSSCSGRRFIDDYEVEYVVIISVEFCF